MSVRLKKVIRRDQAPVRRSASNTPIEDPEHIAKWLLDYHGFSKGLKFINAIRKHTTDKRESARWYNISVWLNILAKAR